MDAIIQEIGQLDFSPKEQLNILMFLWGKKADFPPESNFCTRFQPEYLRLYKSAQEQGEEHRRTWLKQLRWAFGEKTLPEDVWKKYRYAMSTFTYDQGSYETQRADVQELLQDYGTRLATQPEVKSPAPLPSAMDLNFVPSSKQGIPQTTTPPSVSPFSQPPTTTAAAPLFLLPNPQGAPLPFILTAGPQPQPLLIVPGMADAAPVESPLTPDMIDGSFVLEMFGIALPSEQQENVARRVNRFLRHAPETKAIIIELGKEKMCAAYHRFVIASGLNLKDEMVEAIESQKYVFQRKSQTAPRALPWKKTYREQNTELITSSHKQQVSTFLETHIRGMPVGVLTVYAAPLDDAKRLEFGIFIPASRKEKGRDTEQGKLDKEKFKKSSRTTTGQIFSVLRSKPDYKTRPIVLSASGTDYFLTGLSASNKASAIKILLKAYLALILDLQKDGFTLYFTDKQKSSKKEKGEKEKTPKLSFWDLLNEALVKAGGKSISNTGKIPDKKALQNNPIIVNSGDPDYFPGDASGGVNGAIGKSSAIELIHLVRALCWFEGLTDAEKKKVTTD